jgi:hypothetical protein
MKIYNLQSETMKLLPEQLVLLQMWPYQVALSGMCVSGYSGNTFASQESSLVV